MLPDHGGAPPMLPSPESLGLPAASALAVPVPQGGLTLYRLLRGPEPRREDFEPHLTRPQGALRRVPELFRASVSHWLDPEEAAASSTSRTFYLAHIELLPDPLIRVALTERATDEYRPSHVDVWGYSRQLLAAVVDVTSGTR